VAAEVTARDVVAKERTVSEFIPFSRHVTDTIIGTKNGDLLTVIKLSGRSHLGADSDTLIRWVRDLNTVFKGVASDHLALWHHVVRRHVAEYPTTHYKNAFCQQLDTKYRSLFKGKLLMINELYLTIVHRDVPEKTLAFLALFEKKSAQEQQERRESGIKRITELQRLFMTSLARYGPELLGTYKCVLVPGKEGADDQRMPLLDWYYQTTPASEILGKGETEAEAEAEAEIAAKAAGLHVFLYSQPGEFLGYLINAERLPVPVTWAHLAETLPQNRINFSPYGELGEIRTPSRSRFFGVVEVFDYDRHTEPGHLNTLLKAPYEYVLTQSFTMLSRHAAKGQLEKTRQQLIDSNDAAGSQVVELGDALDQLMAGEFVFGEHHATLTVFGDTPDGTRNLLEKARTSLSDTGLVSKVVSMAIEAAFWAQLPCNWAFRPRPVPISSQNFLCFSSLHNYMAGKPSGNPWGPAVTMFKTDAGTPLYFNFHSTAHDEDSEGLRPAGHTIVTGATGQGKTVLLGILLAQCEKFSPGVVVFDKDRGMQGLVMGMGGKYFPLVLGQHSGMNPLQMEPTAENIIFLKDLIKQLVSSGGDAINHHDEVEIDRALETLMFHLEKPFRRLSTLVQSLPNPVSGDDNARPTVHARLLKWCEGGEYGWLFDNPTDDIDLTRCRVYGFDYTEFLDVPVIRTPLMMYLMHRTNKMPQGQPFVRVMDEFWKPLGDEYFVKWAKDGLKTDRKKNALLLLATQELGDALESPIAKTIIQQCPTQIYLPNAKADKADYIEGFKLTEAEFSLVDSLPENSRKFVVKQGGSCAIGSIDLTGSDLDDELLVLSGSPDIAEIMEEAIADVGDDPERWIPAFVHRVKSKEKTS